MTNKLKLLLATMGIYLTDVQFMTAKEKGLIAQSFITFVEGGFKRQHFTKRLYEHLHLHCGFIAHYNRAGFYDLYFADEGQKAKFFRQFDRSQSCKPAEGYWVLTGGNDVTQGYHDINNAMVDAYMELKDQTHSVLFS